MKIQYTKISVKFENSKLGMYCSGEMNKKLFGVLYFTKDYICFSGFESKVNKPTLWCLSLHFIKEIVLLKNSIHHILKIILIDDSFHLIALERKSFSILSKDFINQISDVENLNDLDLKSISIDEE
jgi:hypothetical protein